MNMNNLLLKLSRLQNGNVVKPEEMINRKLER